MPADDGAVGTASNDRNVEAELPDAARQRFLSKRAIRRAFETSFVEATRYESQLGSLTQRARADSKEARDSFLEKRKPRYTGR